MTATAAHVSWDSEPETIKGNRRPYRLATEPAAQLDTELMQRLRKLIGHRVPESGPESLTPREWQVLALVAEGANNSTVGRLLYLSPHTVTSHVKTILQKLGAHNRAHAVAIGAAHMGDRDEAA